MTAGRKHREPWRARKDDNHDVNYRQVVDRLSEQSRQVIGLAQADLRELMSYVDELTPEAGRNLLIDALPQLVSSYGDIAAAQALEWYADLREAERVPTSFTPRAASGVEAEKVVAAARGRPMGRPDRRGDAAARRPAQPMGTLRKPRDDCFE